MIFLRTTTAQRSHFSMELNAGKSIERKTQHTYHRETEARYSCVVALRRRLLARKKKKKKKIHNGARLEKSRTRKIGRRIVGREENNERVTSLSFQCIN